MATRKKTDKKDRPMKIPFTRYTMMILTRTIHFSKLCYPLTRQGDDAVPRVKKITLTKKTKTEAITMGSPRTTIVNVADPVVMEASACFEVPQNKNNHPRDVILSVE